MNMKSRSLFLILLSAGLLWSSSLVALAEDLPTSPTQSTWTDAEVEALVQRLVLDHASHTAAKGSVADEQEIALLTQLAQKDAELRKKIAALTKESKQRQALEGELARVSAERGALVEQLAARDRVAVGPGAARGVERGAVGLGHRGRAEVRRRDRDQRRIARA